jgi:hypothetical protein
MIVAMSEPDGGVLVSTQHRSERAAHESIRGYVHQATLTAYEWLRAGDNEVLVCERNEDIDRLIYEADGTFREISEHQIKAIAGKVTARTPAVHESIFNFLRSFYAHDAAHRRCRFVFSTTAAKTKQRVAKAPKTALDSTDVLERWTTRVQGGTLDDAALIAAIKALVEKYLPGPKSQVSDSEGNAEPAEDGAASPELSKAKEFHSMAVRDALAYLDAHAARWTQFLDSVQWSFDERTLDELQRQLVSMLASDVRTQALPQALLSQRLVAQVLSVSSKERVEERTLTRASLNALVSQSTSDLQAWAEKTHAPGFFSTLLEHEARISRIEKEISAEGKHDRTLQLTLDRINDAGEHQRQLQSIWQRYFKSRVIEDLFLDPPHFAGTVDAFRAQADVVANARRAFEDEVASASTFSSTFPKLGAARAALRLHVEARPLHDDHRTLSEWEESLLQLLREVERETVPLERDLRGNEVSEFERYMAALENRDWISEVQGKFYSLRRLRTPIWVSVAPAGRGKSNLAWKLANVVRSFDEAVVLLTGRDLHPEASLESVVRAGLGLDQVETGIVLEALEKRYTERQRLLFVVVDAINEVLCSPQEAAEALKRIMDDVVSRKGVRVFMTCRDVFWRYQYEPEFELFQQHIELLDQEEVVPRLDDEALTKYLGHFNVQNIAPSDLLGEYWRDNPLLLRLFCEAWEGEPYNGKKPIEFRSFRIIEGYLRRKSVELKQRGFGVVELPDELDRLAAVLVKAATDSESHDIALSVALSQARDAMPVTSASGERLFDALMDMDVILRLEPASPTETHATFALERVEDFFVARWVLRTIKRWDDDALAGMVSAKNLTISAMGTAIAMALDAGRIASPEALKRSLAKTMDTLFDLLEGDQLATLRPTLIDASTEPNGIETLGWALNTQLQTDRGSMRPFVESLALEILGAALFRLSVTDRHIRFFTRMELVTALGDQLAAEIELMRQWALSGFASFPSGIEISVARQEAVALLLATNSPQVRQLAHEWLFWTGRFRPSDTLEMLSRLANDTDLLIRERVAALRYALLHRHTDLASESMLRSIFDAAYRDPPELRHYLLVDFARKTLLEHWSTSQKVLTLDERALVETPTRVTSTAKRQGYSDTEWKMRDPIRADMSRYTFGSRFSRFRARDLDKAVRDTLNLLSELGYSAKSYQEIDDELGNMRNPRHWGGEGRRFERFGKTWANVASFVVLQRWAGTVAAEGTISELQQCFAFESPEYDYLFTLERAHTDLALTTPLRIPASWSISTWGGVDERDLVTEFLGNFPDEVSVSLQLKTRSHGLEFFALRAAVIAETDVLDAWRFANQEQPSTDGRRPDPEGDEIDENFDFHLLANAGRAPPIEDKVVHVCHRFVRTLNDEDRGVLTISPRIAVAGQLRQTEIAGEFADAAGATVVRRVSWRDEHSNGSAVLVRRDTLARICADLGVELAFDDYAELGGRTREGKWDHKPFPRRWRLTFTTEREISKVVAAITNEWESAHGSLEADERFRCHYYWSIAGELGLEVALCKADHARAIRSGDAKRSKTLERRLEELTSKLRDE